jgi:hypothetical protein
MTPVRKYNPTDPLTYISKKPLIVDGSKFYSFLSKEKEISKHLEDMTSFDGAKTLLYVGEPRKMEVLHPVEFYNGTQENLLIVSSIKERHPCASVVCSIIKSLNMQGINVEIWSPSNNKLAWLINKNIQSRSNRVINDTEYICEQIHTIKTKIDRRKEDSRYIILLGWEALKMDIDYLSRTSNSYIDDDDDDDLPNLPPLPMGKSTLDMILDGDITQEEADKLNDNQFESSSIIDIMPTANVADIKLSDVPNELSVLLQDGSRFGYHFIVVFESASDARKVRLSSDYFKHKILFRMPRADAVNFVSNTVAKYVEQLDSPCFRYANGLETLAYRPYLHKELTWDSWVVNDNGVAERVFEDEEDYLL